MLSVSRILEPFYCTVNGRTKRKGVADWTDQINGANGIQAFEIEHCERLVIVKLVKELMAEEPISLADP